MQKKLFRKGLVFGILMLLFITIFVPDMVRKGRAEEGTDNKIFAVFTTTEGTITVELYENKVPITAGNFVKLVNDGFYDGMTFYRISDNFMIQAGRYFPDGSEQFSPYGRIEFETHEDVKHVDGAISMASTGAGVGGSNEFFICDGAQSFLDGNYAPFGVVVDGIDVVRNIAAKPHDNSNPAGGGVPLEDIIINSIIIEYEPGSTTNEPPVADTGGPYNGNIGVPLIIDGSNSYDSDGTIVSYEWDFGDGTTGTGVSTTHTYSTARNYTVILTVTDNDGLTHSNITTANINISGEPTLVITSSASNIELIEEGNEKTITITVYCYNQQVTNIYLEILESNNLTVTSMSPNISLMPGEQQDLLIKIKVPILGENAKSASETILLYVIGDDDVTSNTEQINIKITEKGSTPGFELILVIVALALVLLWKRKTINR